MTRPYYSNADLAPALEELAGRFEFDLTSGTPVPAIATVASQILRDRGMSPTKSLCYMLAQQAKVLWFSRIMEAQANEAEK